MTTATDPFALPAWAARSPGEQRDAVRGALAAGLDRDLDLHGELTTPGGWLTFTLRHRATGILLQLVPGGTFTRGFTDAEERALRQALEEAGDEDAAAGLSYLDQVARVARPVATVQVPSFLLSPTALDEAALVALLGNPSGGLLPNTLTAAGADAVASKLAAHGLRLPSEVEHEHAYRAGTTSPFPWGVSRPPSPRVHMNAFGLERIAEMAEVCADGWHPSYDGAPRGGSPRVARGGAAEVWPWQGVGEWVVMLSAARSSSADHEGFLRVRPARALPGATA